jgi:hypothetical protein
MAVIEAAGGLIAERRLRGTGAIDAASA